MDNPLPWDTIDPAPDFDKLKVNRVEPYLTELKYRSDKRVAVDRDFAFLREEIERFKKAVAEKSVSMNEAKRWKEKNEADARSKARKKDLASRPESPGKVYEITLKNVAEPGLPPPMVKTNQLSKAETGADKTEKKLKVTANKRDPKEAPVVEGATDEDEEAADNGALNVDITMDETKRILSDYINLSIRNPTLAGPVATSRVEAK